MQMSLEVADETMDAIASVHESTAVYTRDEAIDHLLDAMNWPARGGLLCDPSCGDGAFLGRALERVLKVSPKANISELIARLQGWEFYPPAAKQARDRVTAILTRHGWQRGRAATCALLMVKDEDFLKDGPQSPTFDVIAGNPPYLRMLGVPEVLREAYRKVVPVYASQDLMHSFLDRCARVLNPDGIMGFVTADRWLFNKGAAELRLRIGRKWRLAKAERLTVKSAFYRAKTRRKGSLPRVHPVSVVLSADKGKWLNASPIYPGADDVHLSGPPLGEVAEIQLAPWLGPHGIFTVDKAVAAGLPKSRLVPIADVKDCPGGVYSPRGLQAIRTESGVLPDSVRAHLDRELCNMPARGMRGDTYLPPETWEKRLLLDRPAILVPRIAREIVTVRIPAGVLPVNHGLYVVQSDAEGACTLDAIEAFLKSDEVQAWVKARAARLENDYLSISTTLLRSIPAGALDRSLAAAA